MSLTRSPLSKLKMIESQCHNGRCYLRLLSLLPSFKDCSMSDLESTIIQVSVTLGQYPLGLDVMPELWIANETLKGEQRLETPPGFSLDQDAGELVKAMMASPTRFGWEEINGIFHIGHYLENDTCPDSSSVYCTHGWSSKYVLCVMTGSGLKVGGDNGPDLSLLFGDEGDDDSGMEKTILSLDSKINDQYAEIERLSSALNSMGPSQEFNQTSNHRLSNVQQPKLNIPQFEPVSHQQRNLHGSDWQGKRITPSINESIIPDDSSSHLERYSKKFMRQGEVYSVSGRGNTVIGVETEIRRPSFVKDVVRGYIPTAEMQISEQMSNAQVAPINGLSNPFKNNRLNLLAHFHTAIESMRPQGDTISNYDCIVALSKYKSETPSEELAHQMVNRTFDLKINCVIANPFKFPFLELGMRISDDALAKTLDLLRLEYKILWFSEMKSLSVPNFHANYSKYNENRRTTRIPNNERNSKSKRKTGKPSGVTETVLSFVRT